MALALRTSPRTGWRGFCLGTLWLLALTRPGQAADWRLFGVESFSGYLALKSVVHSEQLRDVPSVEKTLEELARLRLSSYVFHPRFLSLTADSAFALNDSRAGESGLRNVDSSLAIDVLRENMLTGGATARSKVEELMDKDFNHYERQTTGTAAQLALRGAELAVTAKVEDSTVHSDGYLPETKEDRHNHVLLLDGSFQPNEANLTTLHSQEVTSDDRRTPTDSSQHHTLDLATSQSLGADRGTLNLAVSSWQSQRPSVENRLIFREQWLMSWSKDLRSTEEAEVTRRDLGGVGYTAFRASVAATKSLSESWQLSGKLATSRNRASTEEETAVHRLSGTGGYASRWGAYQVGLRETVGLTQTVAGPGRIIHVWEEPHSLPLNGATQQLAQPNTRLSSVVIKDKLTHAAWNEYCTITQSGNLTYIAWKVGTPAPPGFEGQTELDVEVDYDYDPLSVASRTSYTEVNNVVQFRANRDLAAGAVLESNLLLDTRTLPTAGVENRYEAGLQATVKRPQAEGAAGATLTKERNTIFTRGTLTRSGWQLSESYQAEFFPTSTGHRFETHTSRLWGIATKTHVSLELSDQTYYLNGQLLQGVTTGKIKTGRLFSPFMRVEAECRAETNRLLPGDAKLLLDTKYLWRQGQLDLTAGYELTRRTYDQFLSHRLYMTLIRAL